MENILNKYKDNNGYVTKLDELYKELKTNKYSFKDIIDILNAIKINNENIIKNIKNNNKNKEKLISDKNNIQINNYIKKEKEIKIEEKSKKEHNELNIDFYIDFINTSLEKDEFLNVLPKNTNKDSLIIIDTILAYYLKEINFLEYNLILEKDQENIDYITNELTKYKYIFNKIIEYKNNLNYITENTFKNNLIYFMDNNFPNVFKDTNNDIENMKSIIKLITSIENGNFMNIKAFTSNEKLKGIYEVRDLNKRNRVIFEFIGNGKYAIICSIINKAESNSIYKEKLYNQIKKYKDNINNIMSIDMDNIKKLALGDNYE